MEINSLLYVVLFILGINIGSFLNVLIDRLPQGLQVLRGRSHCDHCKHQLSWLDLIPIFSWIYLGRRCRFCHSPISIQYPLVELSTGALFIAAFLLLPNQSQGSEFMNNGLGSWIMLGYSLYLISSFIVIFVTDLKYQLILDHIIYPAVFITLIFQIINYRSESINLFNPLLSAFAAGLFFLAMVLATRGRGMGVGDIKLVFLMGLILGFPKILIALYLAFLTGAMVGVILILTGKKRFGQHIPFGPFLSASTIIAFWWGDSIWQIWGKLL